MKATFYISDFEVNDSSVAMLGDDLEKHIARELVDSVKRITTIDWIVLEIPDAKMRIVVNKILRKNGYPPAVEIKATDTVIEQPKILANE